MSISQRWRTNQIACNNNATEFVYANSVYAKILLVKIYICLFDFIITANMNMFFNKNSAHHIWTDYMYFYNTFQTFYSPPVALLACGCMDQR